jgi:hypothetical protein
VKITVTKDDGTEIVFQHVTDCYVAVRQLKTVEKDGTPYLSPEMHSFSWGPNIRELVKELSQATVELQEYLRGMRNVANK